MIFGRIRWWLWSLYSWVLRHGIRLFRPFIPNRFIRLQCWYYRRMGVVIDGCPEFIGLTAKLDTSGRITISDSVTISEGVIVLTHDYSVVTAMRAVGEPANGWPLVGDVSIGSNTFVGLNAIVMPGTKIGQNVIVAAGAVVSGIVEDGVIVAGVPARAIGRTKDMVQTIASGAGAKRIKLPSFRARFVSIKT